MARFPLAQGKGIAKPTRPGTGGGGGGGGTTIGGWITPETYGAVGDNSHDDTAALQAALDYVKANGGSVGLTAGKTYKTTGQLDGGTGQAHTYRITSFGGQGQINGSTPTIHFTGSSGSAYHAKSGFGIEMDHIRWMYDPDTFKGAGTYLVNISSTSPGSGDVDPFDIHHCAFNATASVNPSNGCQSLLRLNQAIIGTIRSNEFGAAQEGIRIGDPGGSYVNVLTVANNVFNFSQSAHIMIGTGDGEAITIRGNTFEDMPANGAIYGNNCNLYSPLIEANWFGDVGPDNAGAAWINGLTVTSQNFTGVVANNRFADVFSDQYHLYLSGKWVIRENTFEGGKAIYNTAVIGGCAYMCLGNLYSNSLSIFDGGAGHLPPTNYISLFNSAPGGAVDAKMAGNMLGPEVGYGARSGGAISNLGTSFEQLVVGVNGNDGAGLITGAIEALVYSDYNSATSGSTELRLQSAGANNAYEVQLIAGTTPTRRVRVSGIGVGFNGIAPITPPVVTRSNTVAKLAALGLVDATSTDTVTSTQQAAGYTFVLADSMTVVEGTSGSAQTYTVPPNSSVAFPIGTTIEVFQDGAGQITIAAGGGVTLRSDGAKVHTAAQYATIRLRKRATDEWVLSGDLA